MPSILFHELIGYKFVQNHKNYNNPNFFLGAMVPDAVNAYGFASKEKRWRAHFRDSSLDKWQINVINFYKQNKNKFDESYLMGYLVHVLTDILCDKTYQEKLYPELLEKGYDYNSAYGFYEKGLEKLENSNIDKTWWKETKENIQKAEKIEINNIDKRMIEDWINYTINKYNNRKFEKEEYLTEDFANEILDKIEKIVRRNIKIRTLKIHLAHNILNFKIKEEMC